MFIQIVAAAMAHACSRLREECGIRSGSRGGWFSALPRSLLVLLGTLKEQSVLPEQLVKTDFGLFSLHEDDDETVTVDVRMWCFLFHLEEFYVCTTALFF